MSRIAWVLCRRTATVLTAAAAVLCFAAIAAVSAQASSATFGTTGSSPYGMVVDSAGNVYVANWGSSDVTKIAPDGFSTVNWGPGNSHVTTGEHPVGITIDSAGNIYTANQGQILTASVSKITSSGSSTPRWADLGAWIPTDIAVDADNNIYTTDYYNGRVVKIPANGIATVTWGPSSAVVTTGGSPHGITVDSAGNIYTANSTSDNVSKITPAGTSTILGATGRKPYEVAVDSAGNVYTSNELSNNVSKITSTGISTVNWGSSGTGPTGISVDSAGNVYTANSTSNNVTIITPQGAATTLGTTGAEPTWIRVDSVGNIYTSNHTASTVTRVIPDAPYASPTALVATPGDTTASIAFTPGSDSGAVIANYQYSTDNGGSWTTRSPASTTSPLVITGLANGTTYQLKLRAINPIRVGVASSAVSVTTPTTPDAPTSLVATPGNGSASIAFTAGSNNGSAITNYEYSTDNGSTWITRSPTSTTSPIVITGLANLVTYRVKLRAINGIGTGAVSSAVGVKPAATPLRLRTSRPSCSGIICTVTGIVPTGATRVIQIATSTSPRAVRSEHGTRAVSRVVTNCPITTINGTQRFTCHARLSAGTWNITTLAKAGSKVIAKSATHAKTTTIPRPAPTPSAVTG